jgi:hypothetical protein
MAIMSLSENFNTIIVTPDYQGKALAKNPKGEFSDDFTQALITDSQNGPSRLWMVGINGLPLQEMNAIAETSRDHIRSLLIDPLVCEGKGIIPTLDQSYRRAIEQHSGSQILIRKDGREHPTSAVRTLEEMVPAKYDHVGVGLTYGEGMLGANDRKGDEDLRSLVKGELGFELSHAHGMQGIAMEHMPDTHALMLHIKQMMQDRYGIQLAWGYDLLIRLVSVLSGRRFMEIEVPAVIAREDRPADKIKTQIDNWGKVIKYGKELFPEAREAVRRV